jgi:uroporphyrinogen decarboxylase
MTHRERVLSTLNLEEPDRVPLDFGSSNATTIVVPAYENLKTCLGLEHETQILAQRARTVIPDESVLQHFDIDTRPLFLGDYTGRMSTSADEHTFKDAWGTTWKKAPDGHFINAIGPFQDKDPDVALLESFNWPDPNNPGLFEGLRKSCTRVPIMPLSWPYRWASCINASLSGDSPNI